MRSLCLAVAANLLALPVAAAPVSAQHVTIETLTDLEAWKTDDSSRLVARNSGRLAAEARLRAWVAWRPSASFELRGLGFVQTGRADSAGTEAYLEMVSMRYFPSRAFILEAGKILMPLGAFGPRRFSNTNPLIGEPDMYPTEYPLGAVVSGAIGRVDYRGGVVSLPAVNEKYSPAPDHRVRPVAGAGLSIGPQFRLGAAYTTGSYLGKSMSPLLPPGRPWEDYRQAVLATDLRYSAGDVEVRAEAAWSTYDAPTVAEKLDGFGWYSEVRATLSPRVFVAARYEHFAYPFILPVSPQFWVGSVTTQMNAEIGAGYRVTPDALVKMSLRRDHWPVHLQGDIAFPDGYAVAMQFSLHNDLMGLFEKKY
jgi:hypothetical protein